MMTGSFQKMSLDERLTKGIELFNNEEFFECHEIVENLWLATSDEYKNFYKGIIQTAVALHHLRNENMSGAKKVYGTSQKYLNQYPPVTLGINNAKLLSDMKDCFEDPDHCKIPKIEIIK